MSKKAIFLDRDGVLNKKREDYVKTPEEFELLPEVENHLKLLVNDGFILFVITNQSMIGRGISTKENFELINQKMQNIFQKKGFQITKIYHCPHTPDDGCECRKPKTKLLKQSIKEYDIDIPNSWLIGDMQSDIIAGNQINCKTIKIDTDSSLKTAVMKILRKNLP